MASLTTVDGSQISFDPTAVMAVADRDADTGDAVTTVYGLTGGRVRIAESVHAFLHRIKGEANFGRLTRPNGTFVWINCKAVISVRQPLDGEYGSDVRAVVSVGTLTQAVQQTPAEVERIVKTHHGSL
jgi:hypothetical protein